MRVYTATVPQRASGMTLGAYAVQAFPLLSAHAVRDAFSARDVKMNGKRTDRDAPLIPGAEIRLYTPQEVSLPVVFENDRVLLINKPASINCDADEWGGMTVLSLMEERAQGKYRPRLCHRLDHQTSGLLLLCKDDDSEQCLFNAFRDRKLEKIYQCLVRGEMRPPSATREAYLIKDAEQARVRIVTHETPGALPIATHYETIGFDGVLSRLRVTLITGRTHQIRAHLSFLSHPILGDDKYGDRALNKRWKARDLKLCATELTLWPGGILSDLDGMHFSIQPPF